MIFTISKESEDLVNVKDIQINEVIDLLNLIKIEESPIIIYPNGHILVCDDRKKRDKIDEYILEEAAKEFNKNKDVIEFFKENNITTEEQKKELFKTLVEVKNTHTEKMENKMETNKISKFAFIVGNMLGLTTHEKIKKYLLDNGISEEKRKILNEILMEISSSFYKNCKTEE